MKGNTKEQIFRINKYLSHAQICSRRQADQLIREGLVLIDGKKAAAGDKVLPGQQVLVEGKSVRVATNFTYLAYNKPQGIVCTTAPEVKRNIIDEIGYPERLFPVGRLDKDSSGLILLTNDGEISDKILRARNFHEKEYLVTLHQPINDAAIRKMASGVPMMQTMTRPCKISKITENTLRIVLTQGLNRQIRRMCEFVGFKVIRLERIRIMNIRLGNLKPGRFRLLTPKEISEMNQLLENAGKNYEKQR